MYRLAKVATVYIPLAQFLQSEDSGDSGYQTIRPCEEATSDRLDETTSPRRRRNGKCVCRLEFSNG